MIRKISDLLLGILLGLLCSGLVLLVSRPRAGQAVLLRPPPTAVPVVVNIDGAVINPGVYQLPDRSRVADAVEAAGGLAPEASPGSVNLAALLEDGDHIFIPILKKPSEENADGEGGVLGLTAGGEWLPLVNINQADADTLISLPGIGPVTAEKIIAYRQGQPFSRIEEIQNVPGIGPATFEAIQAYLTVGE